MDNAQFRLDFPEFSDETKYPDALLTFWGDLAEAEVSVCRFGTVRPKAVEILAAHYIASANLSAAGANPGTTSGVASSKSVGDVSVSYDNSFVVGVQGSAWGGTRYGVMFRDMTRRYGAGAVQL